MLRSHLLLLSFLAIGLIGDAAELYAQDAGRDQKIYHFISEERLMGFMNRRGGKVIIPPGYRDVRDFSEYLAAVQVRHNHWGFINPAGELVIATDFKDAQDFSEGMAG